MHKHAAGRSWGLAKPTFFPHRKRNESKPRPFAIIFFAILEEENEWCLTCAFLKSQAQKTEFLSVCGF
jgi:hypothetical protein